MFNRENANKSFEITLAEEDLILNPALAVKLKNDYQLELPELVTDEIDNSVSAYLDAIQEWLPQEQWKLERFAVLGMFFF